MAKTILLADDSVTIQKVVELTFMDGDYSVVAVSDGAAALEQLAEVSPDLLIADVHMPGADGYEVCRRSKESHPSIPVLLLVGTFEQFDEDQAAAAGADGHLKKPFDSQELLSQVESLIAGAGKAAGEAPAAEPVAAAPVAVEPGITDVPAAEVPTAEIPLADFAPPPPAADEDLFAAGEPPTAAEPPSVGDLEPPPLLDEAAAGPEEAGPLEAEEDAGEIFELAPEDAAAPPDAVAVSEPEPTAAPAVAETAPVDFEPSLPPSAEAPAALEAPALEEAEPAVAAPEAAEPQAAEPPAAEAAEPAAQAAANGALSDEDVDRIARRVAELVGEKALREVAWEVIPDLAEVIIKERIRELESQVE